MLELKHITKSFQEKIILNDINMKFNDRGFVGIQGESGCGKSTLLYIVGMLDEYFDGEIEYQGKKVTHREEFIKQHISYMMQNKDVISSLTVRENIILSNQVSGLRYQESYFEKVVTQLEIKSLLDVYPAQLSGGQLKRVSIAKALLKQSSIILCDEPTGALHQKQAHEVMNLLKKISETSLVVIVSHDQSLLKQYCDHVLILSKGKLKGHMKKVKSQDEKEIQKKHYSLWNYIMRQILYQRNKLLFLFIFQWIVIVAFFVVVTAMNGIFNAISESESHAVNVNMMTVERKNGEVFENLISLNDVYSIQYNYHLDQIKMKSSQQDIEALLQFLPNQTDHIRLLKGKFPTSKYEVIVSQNLYETLSNKNQMTFFYLDKEFQMEIIGVIELEFFQGKEVYCLSQLQGDIPEYKDQFSLIVESTKGYARDTYQKLNSSYNVYSDVIERVDNYQSLLSLVKVVAYVFVGISFIISLLLIAIVESIIYFERKHDVAYLLSLGLSKKRLFVISVIESGMLGVLMAAGGCLFSKIVFYYMNNIYNLNSHFSFSLVIKPIWLSHQDIYILIFISYMLMTVCAALHSIIKMMKTNMIDVLREE